MNGSIGCLPDNCEVFTRKSDAIDYLADLFSEFRGVKRDLRTIGIWYNPSKYSLEYCEIESCDCDIPSIHSDSFFDDDQQTPQN